MSLHSTYNEKERNPTTPQNTVQSENHTRLSSEKPTRTRWPGVDDQPYMGCPTEPSTSFVKLFHHPAAYGAANHPRTPNRDGSTNGKHKPDAGLTQTASRTTSGAAELPARELG